MKRIRIIYNAISDLDAKQENVCRKILMPEKPVQVYVNSKMAGFHKRLEKELAK